MLGVFGCGLSQSMEMLVFSRFLSGIGGGGLFTVGSIIISDMYSMRNRGLAQGMASVFNGLGMGLGGPVGGLVTDWYRFPSLLFLHELTNRRLGWRWAFLIQLPMFMLSFGLTFHFHHYVTPVREWRPVHASYTHSIQGKGKSAREVLKRIDYGGSITLLIAVSA
ncbi:hypothetical protein C0991_012447 [Blastosporella zonata]|nr:hypothetical protein C0991_012447 [Blastosporella zonata]